MIFYLIPEGAGLPEQLEPTQDDARRALKARGLNGSPRDLQHDVPTDKMGLMSYVNQLLGANFTEAFINDGLTDDEPAVEAFQPRDLKPVAVVAPTPINDASDVEDFILNRATVAQVEQIFARLGTRFKELSK